VGRLNFPAHAHVARLAVGDDPAVLFGAVLPDLTGMAGGRFELALPEPVEAGRRLHHRADEQFHEAPAFRAGVADLREALAAAGLASGPSRAAAHLGYELLLDTCLPWDDALSSSLGAALATGADLAAGLEEPGRLRWTGLLTRLAGVRWSALATTADPELAQRIEAILGRRPRLALPPGSTPAVTEALAGARSAVARESAGLFAGAAAALAA